MSRSRFVRVTGHEMHVREWGDARNPALVMWHGLARTGRDFDELARALSDTWFVLCPDTIGRGLSSWARDPALEYLPGYYGDMALGMLDAYGIATCDWLGTSLGGLIGMKLASGAQAARLSSLIINDIAPVLPQAALDRIFEYATQLPVFDTISETETWLRGVYAPFGPADDPYWARMAVSSVRRRGDGKLTLHYDPHMVDMLKAPSEALGSWEEYKRITTPCHVLRGAHSDLLTQALADQMSTCGPCPSVTLFKEAGHAPSLARPEDAELVRNILTGLREGTSGG